MARRSRAKTLVADGDSEAIDDLRWKSGTAYVTFTDGSQYEYDVDRATFEDWAQSSWGQYFNKYIRE